MRKAKGKEKGPRMVHEIKRLSGLGISQRQIAKALDISRNTVKKYLEDANDATLAIVKAPYSAPWAGQVDWDFVKKECERGVALCTFLGGGSRARY